MLAACTAGGIPSSSGGGGGVTIDVSLTQFAPSQTPYGQSGGYSPAVTTVSVGTQIHFVNVDSFAHTATEIWARRASRPALRSTQAHCNSTGTTLSGTASAAARSSRTPHRRRSPPIKPGTYLFGCFFHYGAPMRAAIVAQ